MIAICGCSSQPSPDPRTAEENQLFGPVSMKLDTFSKVKDWNEDNVPDGIEALIEFDDRFGDRIKARSSSSFMITGPTGPIREGPDWPIPGRHRSSLMRIRKRIGKPPAELTCFAWHSIRPRGTTITF
jgi:hypothetical protein